MAETRKEFNRILVPVDGSKTSKKAAERAFSIAQDTDLDVVLMHVIHLPATALPPTEGTAYTPEISESVREGAESILKDLKEKGSKKGVNIKTILIEGVPDSEIIKEAKEDDMVIMGSKGHSALDRILIGSVSEKVLHHSDATVMIVR